MLQLLGFIRFPPSLPKGYNFSPANSVILFLSLDRIRTGVCLCVMELLSGTPCSGVAIVCVGCGAMVGRPGVDCVGARDLSLYS